MTKRIAVAGAGGSPGIGFTRSLREAPERFHLIGFDSDPVRLQRAETDERYLVPRLTDGDYLPVLQGVLRATRTDLLHVQISSEMVRLSASRASLPCKMFLPRHETILACEDKYVSYQRWQQAGLAVPRTVLLSRPEDLARAFKEIAARLWLRFTTGSGGRGAFATEDPEAARHWIELHNGWGAFTASECLERQTVTWQSVWKGGELVVAQGRKRLYWEFANRTLSGVTGITGAGVTVSDPVVDEIARRAVLAVDAQPEGVFGVDLTYGRDGIPRPTEINAGRFFTTHHFFTQAGLNLPHIAMRCAFEDGIPELSRRMNPLPAGLMWIRGMDVLPVLTTEQAVADTIRRLEEQRREHSAAPPVSVRA